MTQEWTNAVNPFNSMKSLVWADRYEMLADSKGEIPQPVSVTIDPTNRCQLNCSFCHSAAFRSHSPAHVDREELLRLGRMIVSWHKRGGPEAVCIAGGGEPLLHEATPDLIQTLVEGGVQVGMITNGMNMQGDALEAALLCRWVGFSVDAGDPEGYGQQKGTDPENFHRVLGNIKDLWARKISKGQDHPSIGYKFLLQPNSVRKVMDAAYAAKGAGTDDFHARPVCLPNLVWTENEIVTAKSMLSKARLIIEDQHFHVYGVTHKFDPNFERKIPEKCEVTPLGGLTFCADGWCYICCDKRGDEDGRMCKWDDIAGNGGFWGSEKHWQLLQNLDTSKCTKRCTFGAYQDILEKVFRQDQMCRAFV